MNPQDQNQAPAQEPVQTPPTQASGGGNPNTLMAILAYLGILIIVPLLTDSKNDPFVKFHIKQGIVLIIAFVIGMVVSMVPVLGWILAPFIFIFNLIMVILGIVHAATGKQKELPLIGKYAKNLNF